MELRLSELGPKILSRDQGVRTTETTELWIIQKYLCLRMRSKQIGYPLALYSKDRPDFRLEEAGCVAGVEVTIATFQRVQIALQQAHVMGLGIFSLDGLARKESKVPIKANAIRDHLQNDEDKSPGYSGHQVEVEAYGLLSAALDAKLIALNKDGFERFQINHLLIYENSSLPQIDWESIDCSLLQQKNSNYVNVGFHRITVLTDSKLIEIV